MVTKVWRATLAPLYAYIDGREPEVTAALTAYHLLLPALEASYLLVDQVVAGKALGKSVAYVPDISNPHLRTVVATGVVDTATVHDTLTGIVQQRFASSYLPAMLLGHTPPAVPQQAAASRDSPCEGWIREDV
jgi:hypothetical protein